MKCALLVWLLLLGLLGGGVVAAAPPVADDVAAALQRGAGEEVLEALREAARRHPDDRMVRGALLAAREQAAQSAFSRGEVAAAIAHLEAAAELAPDEPRVMRSLATVLMHDRQWDRAEVTLLALHGRGEPEREVLWLLARVCYATGRLAEAEDYLLQGLDIKADDAELTAFLAKIRRERTVEDRMERAGDGVFSVTYDGGGEELGRAVLDELGAAYVTLGRDYNLYPTGPIAVIVYGQRDFTAVTGAPAWSGGLYDGKIRLPVRRLAAMSDELRAVIHHEYTHVLVRQLSRGRAPLWLHEGLAQLAEERWRRPSGRYWERGLAERRLVTLEAMERVLAAGDAARVGLVYEQSQRLVRFLRDEYGWNRLLDLLELLGRGTPLDAACDTALSEQGGIPALLARWLQAEGGTGETRAFFGD